MVAVLTTIAASSVAPAAIEDHTRQQQNPDTRLAPRRQPIEGEDRSEEQNESL